MDRWGLVTVLLRVDYPFPVGLIVHTVTMS
jgi:hypothetical protein